MRRTMKVGRGTKLTTRKATVGRGRKSDAELDLQADLEVELTEAERQLREHQEAEKARLAAITRSFQDEISTAYYSVVVFQTPQQQATFLDALRDSGKWSFRRDGVQFLDGLRLVEVMKAGPLAVEMPASPTWQPASTRGVWAARARKPGR